MIRVTTLGLLVLASSALGQSTGLRQFLEAADTQNIDRRISAQQREKAAADFRVAWTSLLPSLTASGGWTHNEATAEIAFPTFVNPAENMGQFLKACQEDSDCDGNQICSSNHLCSSKTVIVPSDQLDAVLRFELPLVDTGRWFRTLAASSAQSSAEHREQMTRDFVRRQVAGAYYGYAAALAVRESARKSSGVAEAQLKLMEIRAGAGAGTELDLLRAKAEVQRTRQLVADTESLVATTRRSLQTVSGLQPPELVPLPDDDTRPEPGFEELEGRVEGLPTVMAADEDAMAASRMATASRLAWVPLINGQFTQRFTNATGFQGKAAVYSLGINFVWRLDVPTFMNFASQRAIESTANLAAERARLQSRDQIHSDWQRLTAALIKIVAAQAQVQAAARAAQVARDRYAAGASTQVDVIQAERDLFSAEVGQIQARTELASARASLHISAGLPFSG